MALGAHIRHISRFMPERIVSKPLEPPSDDNAWFKAPNERRFAFPDYNAADLGTRALQNLLQETNLNPHDIDLILYSNAITDSLNIGIGPAIHRACDARNAHMMQIDNGCVSFVTMLSLANKLMGAGLYKKVVLVTATNFISKLTDFQKMPSSSVLGDGASATLLVPGKSCIISSVEEVHGENYGLMLCHRRGSNNEIQHYWDSSGGPLAVEFSTHMIEQLRENAFTLVPKAVAQCLEQAHLSISDIAMLITHQPNMAAVETWRKLIGINHPRVFDTFHRYGNLFQSAIPVTLSHAVEEKKIKTDDLIAVGTFSNGGDYVASMIIKWP